MAARTQDTLAPWLAGLALLIALIDNLLRDRGLSLRQQRRQLDLLRRLNRKHQAAHAAEADLAARIETFELAYRMQLAAPEALDASREPKAIQDFYGLDDKRCAHFARQGLMARRVVERGVRFVQIDSGGMENELALAGEPPAPQEGAGEPPALRAQRWAHEKTPRALRSEGSNLWFGRLRSSSWCGTCRLPV